MVIPNLISVQANGPLKVYFTQRGGNGTCVNQSDLGGQILTRLHLQSDQHSASKSEFRSYRLTIKPQVCCVTYSCSGLILPAENNSVNNAN